MWVYDNSISILFPTNWYYVAMKKIFLISLFFLVTVGCTEQSSETAVVPISTDEPLFVENQVISLVEDKGIQDIFTADKLPSIGERLRLSCLILEFALITSTDLAKFSPVYLGDGVWEVTLIEYHMDDSDSVREYDLQYKWLVYESSATVANIGTYKAAFGTYMPKKIC